MANETLYATKGYLSIIRWQDPTLNVDAYRIQRVDNSDGDIVAGHVVGSHGETEGLVDLAEQSDTSYVGVCEGLTVPIANQDLDDVITASKALTILRPTGGRTIIAVICDSAGGPISWVEGEYVSVGAAGHVMKFVYNDTNDSTDTFMNVIGRIAEVFTGHTSDDKVIHIWY